MSNLVETIIKIEDLEIGMTIRWNGELTTVGRENLKYTLHGVAFNGCAYPKTVTRVQFAVPTKYGIILR